MYFIVASIVPWLILKSGLLDMSTCIPMQKFGFQSYAMKQECS